MRRLFASRTLRIGGLAAITSALALAAGELAFAGTTPDAQTMVYRGHLEQNGNTFNGQVTLGFDFYDGQGNCLDAPSGCPSPPVPVQVLDGEFSVALILPAAVLTSPTPNIQISINGTPLQGQQRIYPVPFAQRGRTDGHVVAEEALDVVSSEYDGGVSVEVGGTRMANPVPGRELDFAQAPGDDATAGTISYCSSADATPALDIVGTGAVHNHLVRVTDHLFVNANLSPNELYLRGNILNMGTDDGLPGSPGATFGSKPALVHDNSDVLTINSANAFSGGTQVESNFSVTKNETVTGTATFNGAMTANAVGGNVPHHCVVRSTQNSCSNRNGAAQCTLAQCAAYCQSGEIAVSGGGSCPYNWRLMDDQPWGGSAPGGDLNNGDAPTAWATICQVYGNGGASSCPPYNWVECCQY